MNLISAARAKNFVQGAAESTRHAKNGKCRPYPGGQGSDWDNLMARVQQGSRLSKTAPLRKSSRRLVRRQLPDWATSPSLCDSRDLHDTTASPAVRGGASLPDSLAVIAPPALTIATEESIDSPRYRGIDRFDQSIWIVMLSGIGRVLSTGSRHRCLVLG